MIKIENTKYNKYNSYWSIPEVTCHPFSSSFLAESNICWTARDIIPQLTLSSTDGPSIV